MVIDGKFQVPVLFFLNGKKIITQEGEDQFFIDFNKPLFPYISMTDGGSVLAKVRIKNGTHGLACLTGSDVIECFDKIVSKQIQRTRRRRKLLEV